ncbi:hypothetical protein Rsub_00267 [Raphidocelis subcapitata]|uniref:Protein kinase domain-containing protein n=1 Tax=Raphidocelis subcapitata TaxID=307507 RepID=A0A2V0NJX2_9CHLO|nr:hypothetical protein Rsub_00267 [Raphidocelis subcapitata]|eukprot:GBF87556.1 hypothetical protein Rsub_00267 [Raphidocelis subcapitata]
MELALGPRCPRDLAERLVGLEDGRLIHEAVTPLEPLASDPDCQLELEIELHRRAAAASPHVVPFWAAADDAAGATHLLMEWADGGDLRAAVASGAFASEARLRDGVVRPVLRALATLAAQGVVHRDVKPENLFLSGGRVLLGDFGLAVPLDGAPIFGGASSDPSTPVAGGAGGGGSGSGSEFVCSSGSDSEDPGGALGGAGPGPAAAAAAVAARGLGGCRRSASYASLSGLDAGAAQKRRAAGTAAYTAPEVLMAALTDASVADATHPKNDVYALGLVALECLTGRHPFVSGDAASNAAIICAALSGAAVPLPARGGGLSDACLDWLRACLEKEPSRRSGVEELLAHPWMEMELPEAAASEAAAFAASENGHRAKQQRLSAAWPHAAPGSPQGPAAGFWAPAAAAAAGSANELHDWALCGAARGGAAAASSCGAAAGGDGLTPPRRAASARSLWEGRPSSLGGGGGASAPGGLHRLGALSGAGSGPLRSSSAVWGEPSSPMRWAAPQPAPADGWEY